MTVHQRHEGDGVAAEGLDDAAVVGRQVGRVEAAPGVEHAEVQDLLEHLEQVGQLQAAIAPEDEADQPAEAQDVGHGCTAQERPGLAVRRVAQGDDGSARQRPRQQGDRPQQRHRPDLRAGERPTEHRDQHDRRAEHADADQLDHAREVAQARFVSGLPGQVPAARDVPDQQPAADDGHRQQEFACRDFTHTDCPCKYPRRMPQHSVSLPWVPCQEPAGCLAGDGHAWRPVGKEHACKRRRHGTLNQHCEDRA